LAANALFKVRFLLFRCRFCLVPLAKKRDYARTKYGVQVGSWRKTKKLRKKRVRWRFSGGLWRKFTREIQASLIRKSTKSIACADAIVNG
jgi:hypothetical protein